MFYKEKFKNIRKQKKITQKELARLLGKCENSIGYWEQGRRTPGESDVRIMAEHLRISVEQISDLKPIQDNINLDTHIKNISNLIDEFGDVPIHSIPMLQTLKENVQSLRKENIRLKKAIRYKNSFLDSIDSFAYVVDKNGKFLDVNAKILNFFNKLEREILNHSWKSFFDYSEIHEILNLHKEVFFSEKMIKNKKIKLPENKTGLATLIPNEFDNNQNLETAICIINDITHEEELEQAKIIAEKEKKEIEEKQWLLMLSFENARDGCWIKEVYPENKYRYSNKSINKIWGWPSEYFYKDPDFWKSCIHPGDIEHVIDYTEKGKVSEKPIPFRIIQQNGNICWVEEIITEVITPDQKVIKLGVQRDVTEIMNKLEENKDLKKQNNIFIKAFKKVGLAFCIYYNIPTLKITFASPQMEAIFGFNDKTFYSRPSLLFNSAIEKSKIKKVFTGKKTSPFCIEYNIKHKSGKEKRITAQFDSIESNSKQSSYIVFFENINK